LSNLGENQTQRKQDERNNDFRIFFVEVVFQLPHLDFHDEQFYAVQSLPGSGLEHLFFARRSNMTPVANGRSAESHVVSASPIEAQFIVPLAANVVLVFIALTLVLPEADGADIQATFARIECSAIAARAEIFLFLWHILFVVVRGGLCIRGVPNDQWQSSCCV
jgi:hypothetical protein